MKKLITYIFMLVFLAACNQASESKPTPVKQNEGVFVGSLEGTNALIAVVVKDGEVTAYSCGADGTWSSHTAWFEGKLADNKLELEESYGLKLNASLNESGVQGVLSLRDGKQLNFSAEAANTETAAGLYRFDDERGEAGLIVSNDLQATGVFYGSDASASRVTVVDSLTTGAKGELKVSVNNKGEDLSLVLTPVKGPIKRGPPQTLNPEDAPKVIVLMHGMLTNFDRSGIGVNEPSSPRGYWLHEFVLGLLNGEKEAPLKTLAGTDVSNDRWYSEGLSSESIGDSFIYADNGSWSDKRKAPPLSVMMTYRDSTLGLIEQSSQATKQMYKFYRWYEAKYKVQPQLILVGHSMGGLVARFIITNPFAIDLANITDISIRELELVDEALREQMGYLRDRTNYLITLSTPHEGTAYAEHGKELLDIIPPLIDSLKGEAKAVDEKIAFLRDALLALLDQQGQFGSEGINLEDVVSSLERFLEYIHPDQGQISDLTQSFWSEMNRQVLMPELASRGTDVIVPGTENYLIPIYAIGGRSPGSQAFKSVDIQKNLKDFTEDIKALPEAFGIQDSGFVSVFMPMIVDLLMLEFYDGWGENDQAFIDVYANQLDQVERFSLEISAEDLYDKLLELARNNVINPATVFDFLEGTTADTDAVIDYIGMFNPAISAQFPIYLDDEWNFRIDLSETGLVNVPVLACTSLDTTFITENANEIAIALSDYPEVIQGLLETLIAQGTSYEAFLELSLNPEKLLEDYIAGLTEALIAETLSALRDAVSAAFTLIGELGIEAIECADLNNWQIISIPIEIQGAPKLELTGFPAQDGEIDSDGFVPYNSAMGMLLGTTAAPKLDHTIPVSFGPNKVGSWYRMYDSPFEAYNHLWETRHQAPAAWLRETIINEAGPIAIQSGLSVYP